jgi:hypothetical protein
MTPAQERPTGAVDPQVDARADLQFQEEAQWV